MCERTCPDCGSDDHFHGFGMMGAYILCEGCGITLASRADPEAARTDLTEAEVEAWVADHSGVRPGAEAKDMARDTIWLGNAFKETPTPAVPEHGREVGIGSIQDDGQASE